MLIQKDSQHRTVIRLTPLEERELEWMLEDWKKNAMDGDDKDHPNYKERMAVYRKWAKALSLTPGV